MEDSALWAACRAGATHTDLARAASADWLVRGLGHRETLEAGMVFSVTDGAQRDVVAVTTDDPIVLSTRPDPKETLP